MERHKGSKILAFSFKCMLMKNNDLSTAWNFHQLKVMMSAKPERLLFFCYGECIVMWLSSTLLSQAPLSAITFYFPWAELRLWLLWLSWCMVTDCKQQLECELDLSQLYFNAIPHSYCCGIILIFCRGEEELCHFLVFLFTGIQTHSY